MINGANFIGFTESSRNDNCLSSVNPETNQKLSGQFHIATTNEINQAAEKAQEAFLTYRDFTGKMKASFLDAIADEIMNIGSDLIDRAAKESALPTGRLEGERGRTCNQLRMFADLLREGSWVDARIDHAQDGAPGIRTMLFPVGPVVVFGASNFPLAFSTAGGDTASALAAGCPVIVKAHESHLGTNELVARAIIKAAQKTDMPDGVFSSLNGGAETGSELVEHPKVKAVGFTGSFGAGTAIYKSVQQRDEPIPVYAEMGSINPVFLLEEKLTKETESTADQIANSVTLGTGQFCTNPGLVIGVDGDSLNHFKQLLADKLKNVDSTCMLNTGIAQNYRAKRTEMFQNDKIEVLMEPNAAENNDGNAGLAAVRASDFLQDENMQDEVFGPTTLVVACTDDEEMQEVAENLHGQLTITFMGNEGEIVNHKKLVALSREKAGRVLFNGVPTGVRVGPAMQHGGPFPATTGSNYTSVGTAAIRRFVRPIAFQDSPQALLPDELKDDNLLSIYRIEDGEITR